MSEENNYACCPSHCCLEHGCKYGYGRCPVATGKVEQEGPCYHCGEDMDGMFGGGPEIVPRLMALSGEKFPRIHAHQAKAMEVYLKLLAARAAGQSSVDLGPLGLSLPKLEPAPEGPSLDEDGYWDDPDEEE